MKREKANMTKGTVVELKTPQHGKKPNQKLKAYLVYEYLQRNTDEEA